MSYYLRQFIRDMLNPESGTRFLLVWMAILQLALAVVLLAKAIG